MPALLHRLEACATSTFRPQRLRVNAHKTNDRGANSHVAIRFIRGSDCISSSGCRRQARKTPPDSYRWKLSLGRKTIYCQSSVVSCWLPVGLVSRLFIKPRNTRNTRKDISDQGAIDGTTAHRTTGRQDMPILGKDTVRADRCNKFSFLPQITRMDFISCIWCISWFPLPTLRRLTISLSHLPPLLCQLRSMRSLLPAPCFLVRCSTFDVRRSMLDVGCWMLDVGCWMFVF